MSDDNQWPIPKALAWIATRSNQMTDEIADGDMFHVSRLIDGSFDLQSAKTNLWDRLSRGVITATGISSRTGARKDILSIAWPTMRLHYELPNEASFVEAFLSRPSDLKIYRHGGHSGLPEEDFYEVRLNRSDVQFWWPTPSPPFTDEPVLTGSLAQAEIEGRGKIYLGEVVEWIMCRGVEQLVPNFIKRISQVEREMFEAIDATDQPVFGIPENGAGRHVTLPAGIWHNMNRYTWGDATFQSIDPTIASMSGGVVRCREGTFSAVRVASSFVLTKWSPIDFEHKANPLNSDMGLDEPTVAIGAKSRKRSPQKEALTPVIHSLYPDGVPDRHILPDAALFKAVQDSFGAESTRLGLKRDVPSARTILRRVGREG